MMLLGGNPDHDESSEDADTSNRVRAAVEDLRHDAANNTGRDQFGKMTESELR